MTFTTTVSRSEPVIIPESLAGNKFRITITPLPDREAKRKAFEELRGCIRHKIDLDEIREERINASLA